MQTQILPIEDHATFINIYEDVISDIKPIPMRRNYSIPFSCDLGDVVRLYANFSTIDPVVGDIPVDPSVVKVFIKQPDGLLITYEGSIIQNPNEGKFYLDIPATVDGTWFYRWEATGIGQSVAEKTFAVKQSYFSSPIIPSYIVTGGAMSFHYDTTESSYSGAPGRTIMKSFLIPAGVIIPDKMLHIMGGGRFAANAQTKTIAINLGPTLLDELEDSIGNNNGGWLIDVKLTYRSSSELVGRIEFKFLNSSGIVVKDYHFPYAVAAPPFTFSVSGESPTNGNITQQQLIAYLIG